MPQYFTDFAGNSVGAAPPTGWSERWDATGGFEVIAGPYAGWNGVSSVYDFLSWDTIGSISGDCEIVGLIRSSFGSGAQTGLVIHGSIAATSGYVVNLGGSGNELSIVRMDSGTENIIAGPAFTWALNTDYRLRVQRSGTAWRARVWADGAGEPGTWLYDSTDATYTSGHLGLFARNLNGTKTWKWIGVGTGGDPAPMGPVAAGSPAYAYAQQ